MNKRWHITQRSVLISFPTSKQKVQTSLGTLVDPEAEKVEMYRCVLKSSRDTEHLNPTPDLDEMQDWCFRNIGNIRDFDGKIQWVFSPSGLHFTFAKEEDALAFLLAFRTA